MGTGPSASRQLTAVPVLAAVAGVAAVVSWLVGRVGTADPVPFNTVRGDTAGVYASVSVGAAVLALWSILRQVTH